MRSGVNTVQQTLTAEAALVLKHAVAEACKRGHAQATPLHVAATLLVAPGSPFRRACLQTHPHSSQLPQCRALELCFNIALERLQAAQGPLPHGQPSYNNALVAALKRAQAHQRRGCPEQQQPFLAVKVELEQLIISILDDPSVSRVMREAGFSSTDVKSHLEEMVNTMSSTQSSSHNVTGPVRFPSAMNAMDRMSGFRLGGTPGCFGGFPLPHHQTSFTYGTLSQERGEIQSPIHPVRVQSSYINPVLLRQVGMDPVGMCCGELRQVLDVLTRRTRRNPVLIGDSAAKLDNVMKNVGQCLTRGDVPEQLRGVTFLSANLSFMTLMNARKEDLQLRFTELSKSVTELALHGGVLMNVGNLQWLLQAQASRVAGFCPVEYAANEIRELYSRCQERGRLWLIGTASNQTFRNCQVLYPVLETQWELQPIPVGASGLGQPSTPARHVTLEGESDSLNLTLLPSSTSALQFSTPVQESGEQLQCCLECTKKYEKEAHMLQEHESSKQPDSPPSCSSSVETPSKASGDQVARASQPALPLWLQKALPNGSMNSAASVMASAEVKDKALLRTQTLRDLQKKWNQTCKCLHGEHSGDLWQQSSPPLSQVSGNLLSKCQDRTIDLLGSTRPLVGVYPAPNSSCRALACMLQGTAVEDRSQEDSTNCSVSKAQLPWQLSPASALTMRSTDAAPALDTTNQFPLPKMFLRMDPDTLGNLCKALAKKVSWQPNIVSTIASSVLQCRSGLGKRAGTCFRGDTWLLFLGHDRPGKKMMAEALAEFISGAEKKPICLTFGIDKQPDLSSPLAWSLGLTVPSRGKMPLDQLSEAVRQNPSSVIYLEDVEQSDSMFRNRLLRAMAKGRLVDSSGRDVSFSNVVVVMTSSVGTNCSNTNTTGAQVHDGITKCLGKEDLVCSPSNHHVEVGHELLPLSKRKGDWDADNDDEGKQLGTISKKPHLGPALDLNLNISAYVNEKADPSASVHGSCEVEASSGPEASEESIFKNAQKSLGDFCHSVDAVVVFASPL